MKKLLLTVLFLLLWLSPVHASLEWYANLDANTGTTVTPDVGVQTCAFTNSPTWTTGKFNYGIDFDSGTTDYLDCGSAHIISTNDWAFAAWIKPEASALYRVILHNGDHSGANRSGNTLEITNIDKLQCQAYTGANQVTAITSTASIDETGLVWTHVGCKKVGTALTLWINGSQVASGVLSSATMDYTGTAPKFFIGAQSNVTSPFLGQIDEPRAYNADVDMAAVYAIDASTPPSVTNYYVATTGLDTNPGTIGSPFLTVQKCATVAVSGDTCYVSTGTYRETVTPTNSGVIFSNYNNEVVTISGADIVTGWSLYSGSIYRSSGMTWTLGAQMDQIFVDGQMMNWARWPNSSLDVSAPTYAIAGTGSVGATDSTLNHSSLNQANGFWNGATIIHLGYVGWWTIRRTITNYTTGTLTWVTGTPDTDLYKPQTTGTRYYLLGGLTSLDAAGEWYRDGSFAYLWTPDGTDPSGHTIEIKHRQWAFDLSNRTGTVIQGIKIFAAGILSNGSTSDTVIDGTTAQYVAHTHTDDYRDNSPTSTRTEGGIILAGNNNEIKNCRITYSAIFAVALLDTNNKVTNCIIKDIAYAAAIFGGVYVEGSGHEITQNTIRSSGHAGINHIYASGIKIKNNHIYDVSLQVQDNGATYGYGTTNVAQTEIAYNLIHDVKTVPYHIRLSMGIYLDLDATNFLVHHNVVYNIGDANATNGWGIRLTSANNQAYNNTVWNAKTFAINSNCPSSCNVWNNLANNVMQGTSLQNNLQTTSDMFVSSGSGNFQLRDAVTAINYGRVITGITDGFVGAAPDAGAYEYGATAWAAGSTLDVMPEPPPSLSTWYVATTGHDTDNDCTEAQSLATPKLTVWGAVQCMTADVGGNIELRTGTYEDSFGNGRFIKSGASWDAPVTIKPYNGESVTIAPKTFLGPEWCTPPDCPPELTNNICGWDIDGSYIIIQDMVFDGAPKCSFYGWSGFSLDATSHHVRLSNNEIKNFTGSQFGGTSHGIWSVTPCHHIELLNNDIHDNGDTVGSGGGHGIYWNCSDSLLEGNLIHNNSRLGLQFWGYPNSDRNTFRRNRVYSNIRDGMAVRSLDSIIHDNLFYDNGTSGSGGGITIGYGTDVGNVQVFNNVSYGNASDGIRVGAWGGAPQPNTQIKNNIVMNNTGYGIAVSNVYTGGPAPIDTVIQNNLQFGNGNANAILNDGTNTTISGNLVGDPLFTNATAGVFTLEVGSPAIDKAINLACSGCDVDFSGNARPLGLPWDIGAYEYGGSAPITRVLTVSSSGASNCTATPVPLDNAGAGVGLTGFTRAYYDALVVSLTAAPSCEGKDFQKWQKNGVDFSNAAEAILTMDAAFTMTAFYATPPVTTYVLTVAANETARISVSPNSNDGTNSVTTGSDGDRTFNSGAVVTVTARPTANAPLAWYTFDDNTYNDISSNLNGTCPNATSCSFVAGNGSASAVLLNGVNGFVQVADSNLFSNLTQWTESIDFKPSAALTTQQVLLRKGAAFGIYASMPPWCESGVPYVFFKHTNGSFYSACDTAVAPVGAWTNTRGFCSGTTLSVMRNGAVTNTTTVPSCAVLNDALPLFLGASPTGLYFNGAIDNAKIYGIAVATDDNPGNPFTSWTDCDSVNGRVCTQTLGGNETITATYTAVGGLTFTQSAFKLYDLGTNNGVPVDITSSAKVMKGGSVNVAIQTDATGADPVTTTQALYYSKNSGAYTLLSDTCGADSVCWHGTADARISTPNAGDPIATCLSGALTPFSGTTSRTAAGTPSFDISQDACIVNGSLIRLSTSAVPGDTYDFRLYKHGGTPLDAYTVTPRITVTDYNSSGM